MLKLLMISWMALVHPFYVSVTTINHNVEKQQLEISCRIFFDDFEDALTNLAHPKISLLQPEDKMKVDKRIAAYLKKHLLISIDGKPVELQYVGYEIEEDAAWCFLQVEGVKSPHTISINNTLLFAKFPDQTNIMHVTINGKRQSIMLDNPERKVEFEFL